jgi:hypothetical protein
MFTIEDVKRAQRDLGLGDRHVVYIDDEVFLLAHTDAERAEHADLWQCEIHLWLSEGGGTCYYGDGVLSYPVDCFGCFTGGSGWYEISRSHQAKGLAL